MAPRSRAQAQPERPWQQTLIAALEMFGWVVQHVYPLRTKHQGWRTSTTASGWPDLVALRGEFLLAIEVKGQSTRLGDDQVAWLMRFARLPNARAWVLRPTDDWGLISEWVRHPADAPRTFGWTPLPESHPLFPRLA